MQISVLIEDAKRYVVGYYEDDGEQYVHWTEEDWLGYLRLAVGIIGMSDTELFTHTVDIPLTTGAVQELPSPCQTLRSVRGQKGGDGVIKHILRKRSMSSLKLPKPSRIPCKFKTNSDGTYSVNSYTVDADDPKVIIVDPPVPSGVSATLVVTCYAPPKLSSVDEDIPLNDTHKAIVFELLLYYAWGVDIEDQANRERSNKHWDNAMKLLDVKDAMNERRLKRQALKAVTNG